MGLKQFDLVAIKTTKRAKYVVQPPNMAVSPNDLWSVVSIIEQDVLICKDGCTCRIPIADVELAKSYDLHDFLRNNIYGKEIKNKGQ